MTKAAQCARAYKNAQRAKGLEQANVWVPSHMVCALRALAEALRDNPDLEISSVPVRSASTGRLVRVVT